MLQRGIEVSPYQHEVGVGAAPFRLFDESSLFTTSLFITVASPTVPKASFTEL